MPFLIILLFLLMPVSAQTLKTTISIDNDVYRNVQRFLAGRHVLDITNFNSPYASRDIVDFVLIQQAISLGGIKLDIHFESGNYDARNLRSIKDGLLLLSLDSFWLSELNNIQSQVFISQPLIRRGEYIAGLYTAIDNVRAHSAKTLEQIQKLSFVSTPIWATDWLSLQQLAPKQLLNEKVWSSQAKLVSRGWVDVMLAPFLPGNNFRFTGDGYDIVAIEGIKIILNDSRHVAVSKQHPAGQITFEALEKGLTILRAQGRIEQAYTEAGFFNESVKDWTTINPVVN
ncbi:hypothetical protein [Arsukibacterium perlucidum]|uniref:hypothetical protein n=1 Tax=Arsukibacterium perlucidum TaxID=368811 RepID=UPI00037AB446|nr:hypothetical protein [Arsukibacterium perlucidum]